MRVSLAIATGLLALLPDGLAAETVPGQIDLGDTTVAGWLVSASIQVSRADDPPVFDDMYCDIEGENQPIHFMTSRDGGLTVEFTDDGDFDPHDIRFVKIGDATWEYRHRVFEWGDNHFSDVDYPPPPPPPEPCGGLQGHNIILYGCPDPPERASRQVRRSATAPWLAVETLANELLEAEAVRVVYRPEDADAGEPLLETEVSLHGLRDAWAWCNETMNSDAAKRLHPLQG